MRRVLIVAMAAMGLVACNKTGGDAAKTSAPAASPSAGVAATAQLPTRKPGLWVQTMTRDGVGMGPMGTMKICIDAASEAKMNVMGQNMAQSICKDQTVNRQLDGSYEFSANCSMGEAGTMATKAVVTGDFSSKYHMHSESDVTGAKYAQVNGHHATDVDATYAGPCPAGMAAGEVMMANGMKLNPSKFMDRPHADDAQGGAGQ